MALLKISVYSYVRGIVVFAPLCSPHLQVFQYGGGNRQRSVTYRCIPTKYTIRYQHKANKKLTLPKDKYECALSWSVSSSDQFTNSGWGGEKGSVLGRYRLQYLNLSLSVGLCTFPFLNSYSQLCSLTPAVTHYCPR